MKKTALKNLLTISEMANIRAKLIEGITLLDTPVTDLTAMDLHYIYNCLTPQTPQTPVITEFPHHACLKILVERMANVILEQDKNIQVIKKQTI